jgi:hypothetical protein
MFSSLGDLLKAGVGLVIETPASIVADVATLGGVLNDKDKPYTVEALEKVLDNISNATKPE